MNGTASAVHGGAVQGHAGSVQGGMQRQRKGVCTGRRQGQCRGQRRGSAKGTVGAVTLFEVDALEPTTKPLTLRIEASHEYINRTSGLCGQFDGASNDDRIGSDGLQKTTLNELAQSWVEDQSECAVAPWPFHLRGCVEVSSRCLHLQWRSL